MSEVQATPETQADEAPDFLSMSDDEIAGMTAPPQVPEAPEPAEDTVDAPSNESTESNDAVEDADDEGGGQPTESAADADPSDPQGNEQDTETDATESASIDYKAEYERLLSPFKANGREIAVKSVDDAIALMQMGANYNKKMAALKPNLKLMKLLENNGLLNEEKIGFLIDLEKKNPEAINKLVKDSGIDPMDLDADKANDYRRTQYTVDDREIELDAVLDELQDSPAYNRTLEVVGTKWDAQSKQVIAQTPQLLRVINDHVQSGIYDLIAKEVENERVFGRLDGLSDIEAYRRVGDALHARGAFNHLAQGKREPDGKVIPPKPKADDGKLKEKKRAASPTKPVPAGGAAPDFNPLALSDEEFSKLASSKYL